MSRAIFHYGVLLSILVCTLPIWAAEQQGESVLKRVAVFCSADDKAPESYKACAYELGSLLYRHRLGLVTGGSKTGLDEISY